jgi:hypothetical protein
MCISIKADTTTVFDEFTFPIIPDTAYDTTAALDSITIGIWYVNDSIDSALVAKFDVKQAAASVWITTVKIRPDSNGFTIMPYVWIQPQYEPGDLNKDGSVDWLDFWLLFVRTI